MDALWIELSATMRSMRKNAGMSLREAERVSGRGRGNLSQVETGKARPNRALVEWYDRSFDGDGLLLSLYFEARTGHSLAGKQGATRADPITGDAFEVTGTLVPQGALIAPDEVIEAGWALANVGSIDWLGRSLVRIGAHAGPRLLASPAVCRIPDCVSGDKVEVRVQVRAPSFPGACVGYWQMAADDGVACFAAVPCFALQLTVRG